MAWCREVPYFTSVSEINSRFYKLGNIMILFFPPLCSCMLRLYHLVFVFDIGCINRLGKLSQTGVCACTDSQMSLHRSKDLQLWAYTGQLGACYCLYCTTCCHFIGPFLDDDIWFLGPRESTYCICLLHNCCYYQHVWAVFPGCHVNKY